MIPFSTEITLENACRNADVEGLSDWERELRKDGKLPDYCLAYETLTFEDAYLRIDHCLQEKLALTEELNDPRFLRMRDLEEVNYNKIFTEQENKVKEYIAKKPLSQFEFIKYKKASRRKGMMEEVELLRCLLFNLILAKKLHQVNHPEAMRLLLSVCRAHQLSPEIYCITYETAREEKLSKRQALNVGIRISKQHDFEGIVAAYMFIYMPKSDGKYGWQSKYNVCEVLKEPLTKYLVGMPGEFSSITKSNIERRVKEWLNESDELSNAYKLTHKPTAYIQCFNEVMLHFTSFGPDALWSGLRETVEEDSYVADGSDVGIGIDQIEFMFNINSLKIVQEQIESSSQPHTHSWLQLSELGVLHSA